MKEFIEKLIERLEKKTTRIARINITKDIDEPPYIYQDVLDIKDAIDIVNKLAEEYKPKTNADKIRSMTDEELAEFLCKLDTMGTEPKSLWNGEFWIDEGEELLNWLQSEVEGE